MGLKIVNNGTETAIPIEIEAAGGEAIELFLEDPADAMEKYASRRFSRAQLEGKTVEDLQGLLAEFDLTEDDIDGSGSEGRNLKSDYIRAILAAQGGEV